MNCIITKFTFYLGKVKMPSWTIWRYFLHIALISDFFAMFVESVLFLNWSIVNPVENTKTIHTRIPRSNFIVHKNHIWNLSEIHECFWCVLSDDENEKMIIHKSHIVSATLKFSQRSQIFQMWLMWKIIDIS